MVFHRAPYGRVECSLFNVSFLPGNTVQSVGFPVRRHRVYPERAGHSGQAVPLSRSAQGAAPHKLCTSFSVGVFAGVGGLSLQGWAFPWVTLQGPFPSSSPTSSSSPRDAI